jgi:FkbM family methyltransferase
LNYAGLLRTIETYRFRNGLIIKTKSLVDVTTIAVVFIKQEYGKIFPQARTVVDIGGNIGSFALYAAATGKNASVFTYEPEKENFTTLAENIRANHLEGRIHAFPSGVGGVAGKRKLYLSESPYHTLYENAEGQKFIEISCVTLKDVFEMNKLERIDLLKLDCEGAEFEILLNAPESCLQRIQEIRMEYHSRGGNKIADLRAFLEKKDFRMTRWKPEAENSGIIWFKHE